MKRWYEGTSSNASNVSNENVTIQIHIMSAPNSTNKNQSMHQLIFMWQIYLIQ